MAIIESWEIENASFQNSTDISGTTTNPEDCRYKPDGSMMFLGYGAGNDSAQLTSWDLSTDYDPSSKSNKTTVDLGVTVDGFDFSKSGQRLWVGKGETIYQFNLSDAWDITTASQNDSTTVSEIDVASDQIEGIFVGNSGSKLFLLANKADLYEYDMSTSNELSSLSYSNNSYTFSGISDGDTHGLSFRDDGSRFYITDDGDDEIEQWDTASDWSLSSDPSQTSTYDVSGEDATPQGISFGTDGDNFLVGGDSNDSLYQYVVDGVLTDTFTSYETFPDVPHIIDRDRRSGQVTSDANNEFRDFRQLNHRPFYAYTLDMSVLSPTDQDKIQDLSITHSGYGGSSGNVRFLFKDPDDNSVSDVQFGTGDGSTTKFQLKNKYTFGSQSVKYPQGHIDEGTETIKNDGSTVADSDIAINYDSGTVEFVDAPADGNALTASFEFFRLCQFRDSEVSVSIETAARRNQTIEIVEVPGA